MIVIKPDCVANAYNMVMEQGFWLGEVQDDSYYMIDGHAWRITRAHVEFGGKEYPQTIISRSEDSIETDHIVRMMRERAAREAEEKAKLYAELSDPMDFQTHYGRHFRY